MGEGVNRGNKADARLADLREVRRRRLRSWGRFVSKMAIAKKELAKEKSR